MEEWINWIDEIENIIKKLYYIEQFNMAKEAENKLLVVKEQLKDDKLTIDFEKKVDIAYQLADIEFSITQFLQDEGYIDIKKRKVSEFLDRVSKVIDNLQEKAGKQAFEELSLVMQEYNKDEFNEMEKREISEEISKIVLKILETQIKNEEEINIEANEEFCTQEDLVNAIKTKLIETAKTQDEEDRIDKLETAKHLTLEDLKKPNIWRELTRSKRYKNSK